MACSYINAEICAQISCAWERSGLNLAVHFWLWFQDQECPIILLSWLKVYGSCQSRSSQKLFLWPRNYIHVGKRIHTHIAVLSLFTSRVCCRRLWICVVQAQNALDLPWCWLYSSVNQMFSCANPVCSRLIASMCFYKGEKHSFWETFFFSSTEIFGPDWCWSGCVR